MKNIILKSITICALLALGGCKESFFDLKPYDSLPVADALKNESDMGVAMNGVYSGMRAIGLYGRTIPFIGDLMADNVYISARNSGRYLPQYSFSVNAQNGDISGTWANAYTVILRANNIINATFPETTLSKQYKGEALTARALMNFELLRTFAKPYSVDPASMGIPLITKFDPNDKPARATVGAGYDAIIKDLEDAFNLMTVTNKNSSYISKYVAKALQAQVYFYKGDYKNASDVAQDVIKNGGYTQVKTANYGSYWTGATPVASKLETIFEVASDGVNNAGFDALVNMYAQAGYGDGICTDELYALYSDTDVRRSLIIAGTRSGVSGRSLIINKYQNIANANEKDDTKVLRLSELYLIVAESVARLNDETTALKFLNDIATNRDASFKGYTSKGTALIEDIITERRKELAFEGNRYQDLLRLKRDVVRGAQFPAAARSLPVTDAKRINPIPQVELDANPNIKQNEGY